jgi:hypothetical protein
MQAKKGKILKKSVRYYTLEAISPNLLDKYDRRLSGPINRII